MALKSRLRQGQAALAAPRLRVYHDAMTTTLPRPATLKGRISTELGKLHAAGLHITPRVLEAPQRARTRILGQDVINLASNN